MPVIPATWEAKTEGSWSEATKKLLKHHLPHISSQKQAQELLLGHRTVEDTYPFNGLIFLKNLYNEQVLFVYF
jgi:hypothetical protein